MDAKREKTLKDWSSQAGKMLNFDPFYKKVIKGKDGKFENGTKIVLSSNIKEAFMTLWKTDAGDKTFILLLLITLSWTHSDDDEDDAEVNR